MLVWVVVGIVFGALIAFVVAARLFIRWVEKIWREW